MTALRSASLHSLRILHLSDLHERVALSGMKPERRKLIAQQAAGRRRVVGEPLLEVLRELKDIDLLVFTGDIADWGLAEEYAAAEGRIRAILGAARVPTERFFLVPGNHDVNREVSPAAKEAWDRLRALGERDPGTLSHLMSGLPVRYLSEGLRDQVLERTAAWRRFLGDLGRADLLPERHDLHGRLGYRVEVSIPRLPFPVHVAGLDSAWLCGGDDDAGRILVTLGQYCHLTDANGNDLPGLRLALLHHPPSALRDGDALQSRLAESADLLFHGHIHAPLSTDLADPDRRLRVLAAGSLYEGDEGDQFVNGFHVATLHLDENGRPAEVELDLWGWSRKGRWFRDGAVYRAARDGHLRWAWAGREWGSPGATAPPNRVEVKRAEYLRRIAEAEERRRRSLEAGRPTDAIEEEILALRRQHRAGPLLTAGETLAHRWRLLEVIGQGGFATVWRAEDTDGGGIVAVKVLRPDVALDTSKRERFERGARLMARVDHPCVVKVLALPAEDDGFRFVVLEHLPGGDLHRAVLEGRLGTDAALDAILAIGRALTAACGQVPGLRHRDVKPANVLLAADGSRRVTDFDLGVAEGTTAGTTGHLGTVVFAAPEQLAHASETDERADVYGLAMTAIFCVYGKDLPLDVLRDASGFARRLGCQEPVREVLARGVEWERDGRFPTVAAFTNALEGARRATVGVPRPTVKTGPDTRGEVRRLLEGVAGASLARPEAARRLLSLARGGDLVLVGAGLLAIGADRELAEARSLAGGGAGLGIPDRPWAKVPAGSFLMGSANGEAQSFDDERPQHRVEVRDDFRMLATPVTQALHLVVTGENPSHFQGDLRRPVETVTWHQAVAFCEAWSRLLGRTVRLPREPEWEYACRAGTAGPRYGDLDAIAWHAGNSSQTTHPVAEKAPNAWDLYDTIGNVWEWTADAWTGDYRGAADSVDPAAKPADPSGAVRVVRGGGWWAGPGRCRSAYRSWGLPEGWVGGRGFRVLLAPAPSRQ